MAKTIPRLFGEQVQAIRIQNGFSQEELAERCHLHRTAIGRIERGETNITLTNIYKLAQGLGVSPIALLNEVRH